MVNYLERFEMYLAESKKISCNFKVRIHPLNINSKSHLDFKNRCEMLLSKYSDKREGNLKIIRYCLDLQQAYVSKLLKKGLRLHIFQMMKILMYSHQSFGLI